MADTFLRSTEIQVERKGVLPAAIPLSHQALNVLTQVRQTMGEAELRELAESILVQGQHYPGIVVALTPSEAQQYVTEVNELWGSTHGLRWLSKTHLDEEEYYLVVVAGHRRLRACETADQLLKDGMYTSERFTGSYLCEIHFGLTVDQALAIQFHENRHQQVAIHEEVAAAWRTWRYVRKKTPNMNVASFAKIIARTPTWVRSMLRFCELPESVQRLIEPNALASRVSYQLLVQVARLLEVEQKHGRIFSENDVHAMVVSLIASRIDVKTYTKMVSDRIRDLEEGQGDFLFGSSGDARPLRKIALPHLVRSVHVTIGYWRQLEQLLHVGAFGNTSPFAPITDSAEQAEYSPGSPIRLLIKITESMLELLPHLISMAIRERRGRRKLEKAVKDLEACRAVLLILSEME